MGKALLLAMDCGKGGRNAKSFRRSKGRASVMLKPSSEVSEDFPALTFRIGFGAPTKKGGSAQLRGAMLRHVAQGDGGVERPRHRRRGPNLDVARVLRVEVRRPARTRLWHARCQGRV